MMNTMYHVEVVLGPNDVEIRQRIDGEDVTIYLSVEQAQIVAKWIAEAAKEAQP